MNQVIRTATIELPGPPDEMFPLFTAEGERLWVAGWEPEYVYPLSGEAMSNMVFKTTQGDSETIWTTIAYNAEQRRVAYVNVTPDEKVTRIDVECDAAGDGGTLARVSYTLTALTEQGEQAVTRLTEEAYRERMEGWQTAIHYWLEHGEPLAHHLPARFAQLKESNGGAHLLRPR